MDFYWDNVFLAILMLRLLKVASMVVALEPFLTADGLQSKAWLITAAVLFSVSLLALSLVGIVPNDGFFAVSLLAMADPFSMVSLSFLFFPRGRVITSLLLSVIMVQLKLVSYNWNLFMSSGIFVPWDVMTKVRYFWFKLIIWGLFRGWTWSGDLPKTLIYLNFDPMGVSKAQKLKMKHKK